MEFFDSTGSWVVALGKTLVHSLWIGLFLLSVIRLTLHSIPDRYSNLRYLLAISSMLLFMGSVVTLFLMIYAPGQAIPDSIPVIGEISLFQLNINDLINEPAGKRAYILFTFCSYLYFAGILIVWTHSVSSIISLRKMKREGRPVESEWLNRLMLLKESLGIRRNVDFLESARLKVPILVGFLKPAIMVPAGMITHLSVQQIETILMHELYHLRRFDSLINLWQLVVENLFFFNPALRSLSHLIRIEREKCCDDRVLQSCGDPLNYAKALFHLAGHQQQITNLAPSTNGTDPAHLFTRIKRILNIKTMKTNIREKLLSLLLLTGGLIIMLTVTGFSSGFSIVKQNESPRVKVIPLQSIEKKASPSPEIIQDTVPNLSIEEIEAIKKEALEEVDWEEIKKEMELARAEALESVDWEAIEKEIASAKIHVDSIMQDFDFDMDFDMDFDFDEVRIEMEKIDWDEIKVEINESMKEIDWDEIKVEMSEAMKQMEEINWDEIKEKMEKGNFQSD